MLSSCQQDEILDESTNSVSSTQSRNSNKEKGHICLEKYPSSLTGPGTQGSVLQQYRWSTGETIRVKFLNGSTFLQQKVMQYALEWTNHANIRFVFVSVNENADIKINFDNSNASWSYYGNSCRDIAQNQASMNFGWFNASTPDEEFSRTTIHEFGHALGMVHEHQHPNVSIPWNRPAVYAYFGGAPNYWTRQQVDSNIFHTFSPSETNSGNYDRASIMHYFFPNGLTTDGSTFTQNNVLSPVDKSFIAQVYPFAPRRSVLYTNEVLYANDYLTSPNGRYKCIMQGDGNLVVYQDNSTAIWHTNTDRSNADRLIMQGDGNLVLYNANNTPYWHIGAQASGAVLAMQDDGNLVVYSNGVAVWSWMSGLIRATRKSVLYTNEVLYANDYLISPNGRYKCVMQGDGNLVVYRDNSTAIWSTSTGGSNAYRCIMQGDGNLVLYDVNYTPYWHTGTQAATGAILAMQDDGNLVVYSNTGVALWSWMSGLV